MPVRKIFRIIIYFLPLFQIIPQTITNSIVVGGVTSSSARFWVRISEPGEVNIELSSSPSFQNVTIGLPVMTTKESNFAGIVNVLGLLPDTKYYYRGLVNGKEVDFKNRSFSTFPDPRSKESFSFAFGSCQQSEGFLPPSTVPGNVFKEIVKYNPRFFLQIGDWCYLDTTDNLPNNNDFFPSVYSRVQDAYATKFSISYPMDSLLRIAPVDYVYDDHDYMNDNASATTSSFALAYRPNELGSDFAVMEIPDPPGARTNSIKGYKENMPGYPLVNESRGIYHKFTFGNTEIFGLDLRSQRSPNLEAFKKNSSSGLWEFKPPKGHSIIGRDSAPGTGASQLTWFLDALKNSTADWKFVISSVPFNISQREILDFGLAYQDTVLNFPPGVLHSGTTGIFAAFEYADKWCGFPEDTDTLLNFIKTNEIKNVIILSGDSHNAAIDDGINAGLPEIMAGGLDITNSRLVDIFSSIGFNIWDRGGQGILNQNFNNAFGKITVYGSDSVKLSLIDEFGNQFASYTVLNSGITSIKSSETIPVSFKLCQNYPNPFNLSTMISFSIPKPGNVKLRIFNILGEEIGNIINEFKQAGTHNIRFNADNLSSGIYFYELETAGFKMTKKMVLIK